MRSENKSQTLVELELELVNSRSNRKRNEIIVTLFEKVVLTSGESYQGKTLFHAFEALMYMPKRCRSCVYQWLKGSFHNKKHGSMGCLTRYFRLFQPTFLTPRHAFAPRRTCPSWLWRVSAWPAPRALEMQPPALHVQVGGREQEISGRLPGVDGVQPERVSRETTGKLTNSSPKKKGLY